MMGPGKSNLGENKRFSSFSPTTLKFSTKIFLTTRSFYNILYRYRKLMRRLEKRRKVVDDDWSVLQHCLATIQTTGSTCYLLHVC